MKTFKDLVFENHSILNFRKTEVAKQATIDFKNGYSVSVIFGSIFYSNGIDTYEVAILFDGELCYSTDISDDVVGYVSKDEVTEIMEKVQKL